MKEIRRISIADEVVESIKEMVASGDYRYGDKLPTELALCNMLKVSRTSVREAIRVLQALGYVEIRPGKGAFVADKKDRSDGENWYDVADAKYFDFMEVRMAIEELSVRLSVERATDKQILELEQIQNSFIESVESKDKIRLIMLDELFHTKIISFTKNQLLININKQLVTAFRPYRSGAFMSDQFYKNALEPHGRILLCFQIRDTAQAIKEMQAHLERSSRDIESIYQESQKNRITSSKK